MKSPERAVTLLGALVGLSTLSQTASADQYPPPAGGYADPNAQQPAPGGYQPAPAPAPGGYQPAPAPAPGGYPQQPAPAPAPGGYPQQPAPAPAPGGYQQQPAPAGYQQPAPAGYQQPPAPGGYQQPAPMEETGRRLGGWSGQFILSADRLWGFSSYTATRKLEQAGVSIELETSGSGLYVLWGSSSTGQADGLQTNVSAIPRLSFDITVAGGLTVGLSFGYVAAGSEYKQDGGDAVKGPDLSGFAVNPRLGYAVMFGDAVGIWPRVGFTYTSWTTEQEIPGTVPLQTYSATYGLQFVDIEAMLVISPVPNMGITIGPVVDIGVGGTFQEAQAGVDGPEWDASMTDFGLVSGLLVYF
jgi:hypothetical protein